MKYFEVIFRIEAPAELMQTARDILSAIAGEAGFETIEETDEGLTGYVQQQLLNREALDQLVADFSLPSSTVSYDIREAEYRDWNEEWEQQGFEPIEVGRFIIHDGQHLSPHTKQPNHQTTKRPTPYRDSRPPGFRHRHPRDHTDDGLHAGGNGS